MSLHREHYTTEQQFEIEHSIREAMEVSRRNALKEVDLMLRAVRSADRSISDAASRGYTSACERMRCMLKRAELSAMPYEPFTPRAGTP
jgi:hypothetical protein